MDIQEPEQLSLAVARRSAFEAPWVDGHLHTPAGLIPRVDTVLRFADRCGSWKARWTFGRMAYRVPPGLYAAGNAVSSSDVFVTANYKMSFDRLRSHLSGRDAWILVLDTKGINVWCAAGKGTFGTEEIVHRVRVVRLAEVVSHRRLILPQLGAPGVKGYEVRKLAGFSVLFGPVRAEDLPAFLDAGRRATPAMRRVRFSFRDRIVLVPAEVAGWSKYALLAMLLFLILSGMDSSGYTMARMEAVGVWNCLLLLGAYLAGTVIAPALLPWIPGRAFSLKGAWVGLVIVGGATAAAWGKAGVFDNWLSVFAWIAIVPAVASFLAMNFTGASTYTSLSGVRREMRSAVPVQAAAAIGGMGLWVASRFIG